MRLITGTLGRGGLPSLEKCNTLSACMVCGQAGSLLLFLSFSLSLSLSSFLLCHNYRQMSEPPTAENSSPSDLFFYQASATNGPGSYSKLRNKAIGGWLSFCLCFLISGFALLKGIFIGGPVFQQHAALIWGGHWGFQKHSIQPNRRTVIFPNMLFGEQICKSCRPLNICLW